MTTNRPQWARAIHRFVTDEVIDAEHGWPDDDSADEPHDRIEQAMNEAMCAEFGHEIVDDQCNIPEHRYCVWCMKREPTLREEAK